MSLTDQDYEYLLDAGIALSGSRSGVSSIDFAKVSNIIKRSFEEKLPQKVYDAIRGWLLAVRDHYPSIFSLYFNESNFHMMLCGEITGRDIKLRRLALAHLSKVA